MENVILIGASGFVGSAILNEALNRGHLVMAVVPHPEKISTIHPNLTSFRQMRPIPTRWRNWPKGKMPLLVLTIRGGEIPDNTRRRSKTIRRSSKVRSVQVFSAC